MTTLLSLVVLLPLIGAGPPWSFDRTLFSEPLAS